MRTTNTKARAAAVAAVTAILTAGSIGPAAACAHGGGHRDTAASGSHGDRAHGAGHERGDHTRGADHAGPSGDEAGDRKSTGRAHGSDQGTNARHSERGTRGGERGRQSGERGHQPVTVCHLLGNGGYHLLTFDQHALDAHLHHGDLYPVPADGCPTTADQGNRDKGHGHARVTVCHLLGNGGYHLLTFDEHALAAHLHHGDLYPVPAAGCPTPDTGATPGGTTPGGTGTGTTPGDTVPNGTTTVPGGTTVAPPAVAGSVSGSTPGAEVLGVQEVRPGAVSSSPTVLGTQAVRGTTPTAARVAPTAGILPQTGAGAMTLPLVGGLGLVAAGTALMARRRTRTER